jgi:hypothetical protein
MIRTKKVIECWSSVCIWAACIYVCETCFSNVPSCSFHFSSEPEYISVVELNQNVEFMIASPPMNDQPSFKPEIACSHVAMPFHVIFRHSTYRLWHSFWSSELRAHLLTSAAGGEALLWFESWCPIQQHSVRQDIQKSRNSQQVFRVLFRNEEHAVILSNATHFTLESTSENLISKEIEFKSWM